jgi:glucose-1-phosphate thymidylyltransferase
MKGIILAGGRATRLYPITKATCKQLLPVYNKPMIYYPLSVLLLAEIKDILIISTPEALPNIRGLFGSGSSLGIRITYAAQDKPKGIAESFIIAEDFIGKDSVALVLGDNIFFGADLVQRLKEARAVRKEAVIFSYYVNDPARYGVLGFDKSGKVKSIAEKPTRPHSNWVVTGLYFYANNVVKIAKSLKPSGRGELEISQVNKEYLRRNRLKVIKLGRGIAWLDTGTYDSLIDASNLIKTIEQRQGLKIGCIEEIAFRNGYINKKGLWKIIKEAPGTYSEYLRKIASDE